MIRRCNCLLKWSLFKCHVSFRGCNATFSVFQVNMLQVFNFEWPDCMTPILSKASRVSNLGDFEEPSLVVEGTGSTLSHMPFDFFEFTRKFGWSIFVGKRNKEWLVHLQNHPFGKENNPRCCLCTNLIFSIACSSWARRFLSTRNPLQTQKMPMVYPFQMIKWEKPFYTINHCTYCISPIKSLIFPFEIGI